MGTLVSLSDISTDRQSDMSSVNRFGGMLYREYRDIYLAASCLCYKTEHLDLRPKGAKNQRSGFVRERGGAGAKEGGVFYPHCLMNLVDLQERSTRMSQT